MTVLTDILVSELPAVAPQPRPATGPRRALARRQAQREFERALRRAEGQELLDLVAQERAQRTVTRTFT